MLFAISINGNLYNYFDIHLYNYFDIILIHTIVYHYHIHCFPPRQIKLVSALSLVRYGRIFFTRNDCLQASTTQLRIKRYLRQLEGTKRHIYMFISEVIYPYLCIVYKFSIKTSFFSLKRSKVN